MRKSVSLRVGAALLDKIRVRRRRLFEAHATHYALLGGSEVENDETREAHDRALESASHCVALAVEAALRAWDAEHLQLLQQINDTRREHTAVVATFQGMDEESREFARAHIGLGFREWIAALQRRQQDDEAQREAARAAAP